MKIYQWKSGGWKPVSNLALEQLIGKQYKKHNFPIEEKNTGKNERYLKPLDRY